MMTTAESRCRELAPIWSEAHFEPLRPEEIRRPKPHLKDWFRRFKKRYGLAILVIFGLALYGWAIWWITARSVAAEITAKVTQEVKTETEVTMRAGFNAWLEDHHINPKTGEKEDKLTPVQALGRKLAQHIAGLRMDRGVTEDGARTYIWGVDLARLASGKYGKTIEDVLAGNIEAYIAGHETRPEDDALGLEIAQMYLDDQRPSRWRPDLEFAEINADGSVTARNELRTGPRTAYWWFGM